MQNLLTAVQPFLVEGLATILVAVFTWLSASIKGHLSDRSAHLVLQSEAIFREALHRALETGAAQISEATATSTPQKIEAVVRYVNKSVPDAVVGLKAQRDVLEDLARSKLRQFGVQL
ncbi:hypothetical protein [Planktotalea sp.]|uniref:hypothetical protein n=1 Tax=Planktotalea sp. TaxID=2029877 RepID=UPI003D6AE667